jgi:hypothetical protein
MIGAADTILFVFTSLAIFTVNLIPFPCAVVIDAFLPIITKSEFPDLGIVSTGSQQIC